MGSAESGREPPNSRNWLRRGGHGPARCFALTREDPDAVEEQRFVTLGLSDEANLLVVVFAYREPDIIRVLSAWRANRRQKELYEKGRS